MRALITGIGGFVGRHLLRHLQQQGDQVCGIGRAADCQGLPETVTVAHIDLTDREALERVIGELRPETVYHLAAQSSPRASLGAAWATLSNNLLGQLNLFEALLHHGLAPRVLVVGSSDEYGRVRPEEVPTSEEVPLRPTTPYAVSKVGQDMLGYQYFAQHGLPVVRVRPFNHTGPGQSSHFVIPSFARQLAEIERGDRPPVLQVGNLEVERDFCDVRDIVRGYRLAALVGAPGDVYNLGCGRSMRIAQILDELIALCRVPVTIRIDPELRRPADVPRQAADIRKFTALTGWQPSIPWHTTLSETLEYWRERAQLPAAISGGLAADH